MFQTLNSLNQTPCEVAAYLAAECNNGRTFALSPASMSRRSLIDAAQSSQYHNLIQGLITLARLRPTPPRHANAIQYSIR